VPGLYTPEVIVPAETVPAVDPSVVSIFEPEILNEEPTLVAVERAASTVSCTLDACLVTRPPAFAADVVISNIPKARIAFFIEL
jgi:hypothetical protein